MIKLSNKRYFGIDISESAVKLIEIYKTREGYRLKKGRLIELGLDPDYDDDKKRDAAIKQAIGRLIEDEKIESGKAAISISGQSVFVRPLKIPKIAKHKIEQIVHYEAQLQVPFPINDVIWDYELFAAADKPELEAALVAVKKDIVENKLKLFSDTAISVDFVEMDAFALFNALDFLNAVKNKVILDIGAKITDILIVSDKKIWSRSILIGGNDLTKAIATDLKISFKEAEALKRREGVVLQAETEGPAAEEGNRPFSYPTAISNAVSPVLVELLTNVSKSIGYYKSQFGETSIFDEILITGGGSKLKNINEFVKSNIDIPTRSFSVLEAIKTDLDFEPDDNFKARMGVASGLALRTVIPLSTKSNLLPREILRAKEFEKKRWYIFGSLLIAALMFITLTGFVGLSTKRKRAALERASALVEHYTRFHKDISALQSDILGLKSRLDFMSGVSIERKRAIETLSELARLLPESLWLTEISQDKDTLLIKGRTKGTFENINAFKDALIASGYFKSVKVESANVLKLNDAIEDIRAFTIEIELRPAAAADGRGDA